MSLRSIPRTVPEQIADLYERLRKISQTVSRGPSPEVSRDHGGLTGLGDDDHPQYVLLSLFLQLGDLLVGTGNGTVGILSGGPDGYALLGDTSAPLGMSWQPTGSVHDQAEAGDLAAVAAAAAAGSNPEIPYADHVHEHGTGYLPDAHHAEDHAASHAADGADPYTVKYESGAGATITDGDFASTPANGTLAVVHDTTSGKSYLYARANGTWKAVEIT